MLKSFVPALLAVASLAAQSPLAMPFAANNSGTAGWTIFFDLDVVAPAGITIRALDVNCGTTALGTVGEIELYVGPTSYVGNVLAPAQWTRAEHGGVIAAGNNVPAYSCLGDGVYLPPGPHAIALRHVGVGIGFTNGTSTNLTGTTNEVHLTAGAACNGLFTGSTFSPRVWNGNLHYTVGNVPGTGCAQSEPVGDGCYRGTTTFYETLPSLAAFDFAGTSSSEQGFGAVVVPQGYQVVAGVQAWFPPSGPKLLDNAPSPTTLGDTQFSRPLVLPFPFPFAGGSTTVLHAASDGYLLLGPTTSNACDASPTPGELLSQLPRLCPLWSNLHASLNESIDPASGIYFDVDVAGQAAYVTWLRVADRSGSVPTPGTTSVSMQVALFSSGYFEFRYRAIVPNATSAPVLVGMSKGTADGLVAIDPGSVDLSASLPLTTAGPDSRPLVHTVGLPRLGTNFDFFVRDIENLLPVAFLFLGDTAVPAGASLAPLGAPGCSAFTNANLTMVAIPAALPAGTAAAAMPIQNIPALVGITITSQAAAFTGKNALGLATSNGVTWTVGH